MGMCQNTASFSQKTARQRIGSPIGLRLEKSADGRFGVLGCGEGTECVEGIYYESKLAGGSVR